MFTRFVSNTNAQNFLSDFQAPSIQANCRDHSLDSPMADAEGQSVRLQEMTPKPGNDPEGDRPSRPKTKRRRVNAGNVTLTAY